MRKLLYRKTVSFRIIVLCTLVFVFFFEKFMFFRPRYELFAEGGGANLSMRKIMLIGPVVPAKL